MSADLLKSIKIYSTLGKDTTSFIPATEHPKIVSMYHCGPTVYQRAHVGNLRAYVFADTIRRVFEASGMTVQQVINITDVGHLTDDADSGEDKLEREAQKTNTSAIEISQKYTELFLADLKKLNINTSGTVFPKATEHIQEQIDLIKKLESLGHTYKTSDAIYFDTSTFVDYGKLGSIYPKKDEANSTNLANSNSRIEENPEKRNQADFALWKFSTPEGQENVSKRQQEWNSPWGIGFPGWHIECSAMSMKYLGETFDIHTGGIDHIPVHHNNEIAQSEAATNAPLARYWMHNNFITIDDQKISKSLGNTLDLDDLESDGISPIAYRYWLLTAHYASQANLTNNSLLGAQKAYQRLVNKLAGVSVNSAINQLAEKYFSILADNFNTPNLLAEIWTDLKADPSESDLGTIRFVVENWLGLPIVELDSFVPDEIMALANQREEARQQKDWEKSDLLRDQIEQEGYVVKDTPDGQKIVKN